MIGNNPIQAQQIFSGLLSSLDRGLALESDHPNLTKFLLEGQIVSDHLMEAADRVDLVGVDTAQLSLQLAHKCRLWFQKSEEAPVLLGSGSIDVVVHGLLVALEGGDGETLGNCFDRPVKKVMKLREIPWTLYATLDQPRTLFFRNPEAWQDPVNPDYWKSVEVSQEQAEDWRLKLTPALIHLSDSLARTVQHLKNKPRDFQLKLIESVRRTAAHYSELCRGGLEVFKALEVPGSSWDFDAQFLDVGDF